MDCGRDAETSTLTILSNERARSASPSTASPASALEMSGESVSQARSKREDRCYQERVRWDVRVNLPMSPSSVYVLPPGCILCGGTRVSTTDKWRRDRNSALQKRSDETIRRPNRDKKGSNQSATGQGKPLAGIQFLPNSGRIAKNRATCLTVLLSCQGRESKCEVKRL